MSTNQDISYISFIMRGNHFLVHGHKKDLPPNTCIFHLSKICSNFFLVSAMLLHISLLSLSPKPYFKISTFQPNYLCSSSLKLLFYLSLTFARKTPSYLELKKTSEFRIRRDKLRRSSGIKYYVLTFVLIA